MGYYQNKVSYLLGQLSSSAYLCGAWENIVWLAVGLLLHSVSNIIGY